jgi:hypothetical protein
MIVSNEKNILIDDKLSPSATINIAEGPIDSYPEIYSTTEIDSHPIVPASLGTYLGIEKLIIWGNFCPLLARFSLFKTEYHCNCMKLQEFDLDHHLLC